MGADWSVVKGQHNLHYLIIVGFVLGGIFADKGVREGFSCLRYPHDVAGIKDSAVWLAETRGGGCIKFPVPLGPSLALFCAGDGCTEHPEPMKVVFY